MLDSTGKVLRLTLFRPRRAWLMARIAGWAVILSSAVRFRSLPSALQLLSVQPSQKQNGQDVLDDELSTAIDAVLGLDRFVFRPICWKRAALLHHFLGLQGCATTIVFGLRKDAKGELKGHAWLEENGRPVFERDEPNYTVTYRFPSTLTCDVDLARMLPDE